MFPPKASGTSEDRTSPAAGATPTVPSIGSIGSPRPQARGRDSNTDGRPARAAPQRHGAGPSLEQDGAPVPVRIVDPGPLLQRLLQRGGAVRARQAAEQGDS